MPTATGSSPLMYLSSHPPQLESQGTVRTCAASLVSLLAARVFLSLPLFTIDKYHEFSMSLSGAPCNYPQGLNSSITARYCINRSSCSKQTYCMLILCK